MELTAAGFILVPLSVIVLFRPNALIQLVLITSALGAAAPVLLNFGGEPVGLAASFVPGLLFIGMVGLDYLFRERRDGEQEAMRAIVPMLLFLACAIIGAVVLPQIFVGQFLVWPQRVGLLNLPVPLSPNPGNVTQSLYLAVDTMFLVLAALYTACPGTRPLPLLYAYLASGYLAAVFCFWQFASKLTGIYYPEAFLYTNPRWAILSEEALGTVNRISGPFTEPAGVAGHFAGIIFACLWLLLRGQGGFCVRLLLFLSFAAVLLSTSTTGIIFLAVFVPAVLVRSAAARERRAIGLGLVGIVAGLLTLFTIAYLAFPSLVFGLQKSADTVIEATLNKPESESGIDRSTKDIDSISVLGPSYGLGAGWGSVRSSSIIPGLLGNAGIPGVLLLGWFAARAARLVARARRFAPAGEDRVAMDAMAGSVLGTLCAAAMAGPTIDGIDFFARLAIMVGCAARICATAQKTADFPPRSSNLSAAFET